MVAVGRVGHDLAHLILGIETAVADAVVGVEVLADAGAVAPRADFGELRIFLDLDAPALVLGQVPVEPVDLIGGGNVDVALGLLDRPEMTAGVQMDAAVVKARSVQDGDAGEEPGDIGSLVSVHLRREHLLKRLDGVEEAAEGRRFHIDTGRGHFQEILLGAEVRVQAEVDLAAALAGHGFSGDGFQRLREGFGRFGGGLIQVFIDRNQGAGDVEGTLGEGDVVGHRDYAEGLRLSVFAAGKREDDGEEGKDRMFHFKGISSYKYNQ